MNPAQMVGAESVIAPSQRNPIPVRDNTVFTVSAGVRVTPRTRGVFAVIYTWFVMKLKHIPLHPLYVKVTSCDASRMVAVVPAEMLSSIQRLKEAPSVAASDEPPAPF